MRKVVYITVVLLMFVTSPVFADCTYNGKSYPTGTTIGGYVCTESGSWDKR